MNSIETSNFQFLTLDKNNKQHLEFLSLIENDPLINRYLGNIKYYFTDISFDSLELSNHYLVTLDNKIVGFISLFDYLKHASLNYALQDKYRGVKLIKDNSIGTMMIKEFTDEIFINSLSLEYFELIIARMNIRSQKAAEKAGFKYYKSLSPFNSDEYRKYKTK